MKNFNLMSTLLISLVAHAVIKGGTIPSALMAIAILAFKAYEAFEAKKLVAKQEELESFKSRLSSIESKFSIATSRKSL